MPGRGTVQASLIVRLAQSWAKLSQRSYGCLFLDVVQAFYRSLRELLLVTPLDDQAIACVVRAAGLPPAAMHALAERLRDYGARLHTTNAHAHVIAQTEQ